MVKAAVIMTCFNRKEYTLRCVNSLMEAQSKAEGAFVFEYVIVDDKSKDGTKEALIELKEKNELLLTVVDGTGSLFYSGGMRYGIDYVKNNITDADFVIIANDDVRFDSDAIVDIMKYAQKNCNQCVVGATKDSGGKFSYGGVRYTKGIKYDAVKPEDENLRCDTFNANCVIIPGEIFRLVPTMDAAYTHSIGDFDYGLSIKKLGYEITVFKKYIGVCDKNDVKGTWNDTSLKRIDRLKKKESPKGLPRKDWFHFLNKNFGLWTAITKSVTPYIRILLNK